MFGRNQHLDWREEKRTSSTLRVSDSSRCGATHIREGDARLGLHLDLALRLADVHRVEAAKGTAAAATPAASILAALPQKDEATDDQQREGEIGENGADGGTVGICRRRLHGERDAFLSEHLDKLCRLLTQQQCLMTVAIPID